MKKENLLNILEEYISRVPYHPFTIVLNDGSSCEIDNPNAIGFRPNSAIYFISPGGRPLWFDQDSVVKVVDGMLSDLAS